MANSPFVSDNRILYQTDESLADLCFPSSAADKRFNQAVLAIERYDVEWDFGPLEFRDIKIVSIVHSMCAIRCWLTLRCARLLPGSMTRGVMILPTITKMVPSQAFLEYDP